VADYPPEDGHPSQYQQTYNAAAAGIELTTIAVPRPRVAVKITGTQYTQHYIKAQNTTALSIKTNTKHTEDN